VKSYVLQIPAAQMREHGFVHPMGETWAASTTSTPAF
jgi:hypothetical protein